MSHFSVLVIRNWGQSLEKLMQPFHEYECTGICDEYVVEVEEDLEKYRQDYLKHNDEGQDFAAWLSGWTGKKLFVQGGAQLASAKDFTYGRIEVDQQGSVLRVVDVTNPNYKWDWWVLGGRWNGFFRVKRGAVFSGHVKVGRPGMLGTMDPHPFAADECRKCDVDLELMRSEAEECGARQYDAVHKIIAGRTFETWDSVCARFCAAHEGELGIVQAGEIMTPADLAREFYFDQPVIKDLNVSNDKNVQGVMWKGPAEFMVPRAQYLQLCRDRAAVPYAVLYKGQWMARGEMGWFGCSNDEMSEATWLHKVNELIDQLPDEAILACVDCHI